MAEVEKEQLFLLDYLCSNKKKYVYFVIPVTENEIGISLQSDAVSPNWYDYSITGLTEIGENIYVPYLSLIHILSKYFFQLFPFYVIIQLK